MVAAQGRLVGIVALALIVPAMPGCIQFDGPDTLSVRILVTQDLGGRTLHDETIVVADGSTAMDALHAVAVVETAYAGGFVTAIDGIASRYPDEHVDWFYHVNGVLASTGAATHELARGDVVVWDHRPWNGSLAVPVLLEGLALEGRLSDALASPTTAEELTSKLPRDTAYAWTVNRTLVVADAWGVPTHRIGPPWLVVHATGDVGGAGFDLVAATSGPDGHGLIGQLHDWTPSGVGVVATPNGLVEVPA